MKEGIVIHLAGGVRFRPAAKHGLPFVAWTRSESFHMTAFKHLPPWGDFLKGRQSDMLRMRLQFTERLQKLQAKHSHLQTAEDEADAHEVWTARQTLKAKRQKEEPPRMTCAACATVADWYAG